MRGGIHRSWVVAVVLLGLALRVILAYHGHSGLGKPPMRGDFEAQRHWVEITNALPPHEWYRNGTDNDLQYWGLDYPPLSAWHARAIKPATELLLWAARTMSDADVDRIVRNAFGLHTSRGNEAPETILIMRAAAFLTDVVCYIVPALWLLVELRWSTGRAAEKDQAGFARSSAAAVTKAQQTTAAEITSNANSGWARDDEHWETSTADRIVSARTAGDSGGSNLAWWACSGMPTQGVPVAAVLLLVTPPAQVWIDHGHFQFNAAALGPMVACAAIAVRVARIEAVAAGRDKGARLHASAWNDFAFCALCAASIMFKQMSLYFSLAMAAYLGERVISKASGAGRSLSGGAASVVLGGVGGVGVIVASLAPPLVATDVLTRMFPFARGLYEDKVSNVWCALSPVLKMHVLVPNPEHLVRICGAATVLAAAPAVLAYVFWRPPLLLRWPARPQGSAPVDNAVRFGLVLAASALSFFLFAFQVHEKGIMMPCCGLTIAAAIAALRAPDARSVFGDGRGLVHLAVHMNTAALFSMAPLAVKDEHMPLPFLPVFGLLSWWSIRLAPQVGRARVWLTRLSLFSMWSMLAFHAVYVPTAAAPDLVSLLYAITSCGHFVFIHGWLTLLLFKR